LTWAIASPHFFEVDSITLFKAALAERRRPPDRESLVGVFHCTYLCFYPAKTQVDRIVWEKTRDVPPFGKCLIYID
jgi:hypothetical protein